MNQLVSVCRKSVFKMLCLGTVVLGIGSAIGCASLGGTAVIAKKPTATACPNAVVGQTITTLESGETISTMSDLTCAHNIDVKITDLDPTIQPLAKDYSQLSLSEKAIVNAYWNDSLEAMKTPSTFDIDAFATQENNITIGTSGHFGGLPKGNESFHVTLGGIVKVDNEGKIGEVYHFPHFKQIAPGDVQFTYPDGSYYLAAIYGGAVNIPDANGKTLTRFVFMLPKVASGSLEQQEAGGFYFALASGTALQDVGGLHGDIKHGGYYTGVLMPGTDQGKADALAADVGLLVFVGFREGGDVNSNTALFQWLMGGKPEGQKPACVGEPDEEGNIVISSNALNDSSAASPEKMSIKVIQGGN